MLAAVAAVAAVLVNVVAANAAANVAAADVGVVVDDVAYGADPKQHVSVYHPPSTTPSSMRPVIVFFHGGVWQFGDRSDVDNVGRAAVDAGFVGVVASYRLAPRHRWPAQRDDAAAVLHAVVRQATSWGGDPTRVVLVGHSAGAQLAQMVVAGANDVDASAVCGLANVSGVFDLRAALDEDQDDGGFARFVAPVFGREEAVLRAASPLELVVAGGPAGARLVQLPQLFVTGSDDYGAMRAQSFAMARAVGFARGGTRAAVAVVDVAGRDHFGLVAGLRANDPVGQAVFAFARKACARPVPPQKAP